MAVLYMQKEPKSTELENHRRQFCHSGKIRISLKGNAKIFKSQMDNYYI